MKRGPVAEPLGLARELLWGAALIAVHARQINEYLARRECFDSALLASDHLRCAALLNELDELFGQTLFSIDERIALLQAASGLQAQKTYCNRVVSARPRADLVAFLAASCSERNEENTTASRFSARINGLFSKWQLDSDFASYLRYRLLGEIGDSDSDLEAILRFELTSPVLDYYDTYVGVLLHIVSGRPSKLAWDQMTSLASLIADQRLRRGLDYQESASAHLIDDTGAWGAVLRGDWALAQRNNRELPSGARSSLAIDVICNVVGDIAPTPRKTLSGAISESLTAIARRSDDFEDHVDRLNKLRINHCSSSFSASLTAMLQSELSSEPIVPKSFLLESYLRSSTATISEAIEAGSVVASDSITETFAVEYFEVVAGNRAVEFDAKECDGRFLRLAQVAQHYQNGEFIAAVREAAPLFREHPYFKRRAARVTARALLAVGNLGEAIDVIVRQALDDPRSIRMLPIADAARPLRDKLIRRTVSSKISTPIILDLYFRYVDDELRKARQYAYDEFLRAHDCMRPHEIAPLLGTFPADATIYYLRFVCIPQNMQGSPVFSGTKDIEDERIKLCYLLASLDPQLKEAYIDEAVAVARDQTIREAMLRAEQSKIYINETGLRAWANRDLLESFSRYKALSKLALTKSQAAALTELFEEIARGKAETGGTPLIVRLPTHEAIALLQDMIKDITRAAISSPEFGLDSYLGTRIRHGTLSGQLRSALVERKLVTEKRTTNMPYANNEYWWNAFGDQPWPVLERIMIKLNAFSEAFDDLVDTFIRDRIQVREPGKPLGLFSSSISAAALSGIVNSFNSNASLDDLVDLCLEAVLREAEASLRRVQDVISDEIKPRINDLFSALEEGVVSALTPASEAGRGEFEWAVRTARGDTMRLVERVRSWFRLVRAASEPTLTLDQLIDTSVRTVETLHREFRPRVDKTIPDLAFEGALTRFTDIFYQMLENVWQHSRFQGSPQIAIEASYNAKRLSVRVESDVDRAVRTQKVERDLQVIREDIASSRYQDATRTEGRSGLKKLFHLISQGQKERPLLEFGFAGAERFFVEFAFDIPAVEMRVDGDSIDR